jgi:hypothetical protein
MLFFPVFARLQSRPDPQVELPRLVPSSIPVIQPLCFQTLTHSFAQRRSRNSFFFNRLRTLSITTEGVPPSRYFHRLPLLQSPLFPVVHPISLQALTKCSSRNSFALVTIHFHWGCTPLALFSTGQSSLSGPPHCIKAATVPECS